MHPCHRQACPDAPLMVYLFLSGEKLTGTDEIPACFHILF